MRNGTIDLDNATLTIMGNSSVVDGNLFISSDSTFNMKNGTLNLNTLQTAGTINTANGVYDDILKT